MSKLDFDGRVVVVTGAARGMGAAHARELAERGARVVVNDLGGTMFGEDPSAEPANALASQIVADGGIAVADASDIGTSDGCAALIAHAVEEFGQLDGVLHNAGIGGFSPVAELDEAALEKMVRVHLFGAANLSREAWPHLARTHGRLLFISSGAGLYGVPTLGHYAAAKVGMIGLARVAASEGEADGISANVLAVAAASRMMDTVMADAPNMLSWFHKYMKPELPSAAAVWLLHPDCPANGQIFQAFGPHFAEVFIAETVGRSKLDMKAEDVRDLFDEIQDREGYIVATGPDDFHGHMFRFIVEEAGAAPLPADDSAPVQIAGNR